MTTHAMTAGSLSLKANHEWAQLPKHIIWGNTNGVAIDSQDRVYIAHTSTEDGPCKDCIVVCDPDGRFLYSFGSEHFGHAHGLTIKETDADERLVLVDDEKGIYEYSLDGTLIKSIPRPGFYDDEKRKYGPANVAIAVNGDYYLAEGYGSSYVLHFDSQGQLVNRFGGSGTEDQDTNAAHGVFIADVGNETLLHITVSNPSLIKRFTLDGQYHSQMPGTYLYPRNIFAHKNIWAIPEMEGRLTIIDNNTDDTYHLGSWVKVWKTFSACVGILRTYFQMVILCPLMELPSFLMEICLSVNGLHMDA